MIILTGKADSYAQFITVLLIFVAVLAVTAWVTKWIAGYQKKQGVESNIEVRETVRIANNKYIQLNPGRRDLFCCCGLQGYCDDSGRDSRRTTKGYVNIGKYFRLPGDIGTCGEERE